MTLEGDIALLKGIPLFGELPAEQLRLLAFSAVRLELAPAQVLFREGSKASSGYVVASGRVELSVGAGDRKRLVATCEPGSLIGEIALFIETRRPATAIAVAAGEVLEVERKVVLRMLNEYPRVALAVRAMLSDRLTATVSELARVRQALMEIGGRPARRR
jgi:CRP-like cAMP-binding protein